MIHRSVLTHLHSMQVDDAVRSVEQVGIGVPLLYGGSEQAICGRLRQHCIIDRGRADPARALSILRNTSGDFPAYGADTVACDAAGIFTPDVPIPVEPLAPLIDEFEIIGMLTGELQ